ncbi:hypothetical protein R6Q59_016746 [Mikania micrantha]
MMVMVMMMVALVFAARPAVMVACSGFCSSGNGGSRLLQPAVMVESECGGTGEGCGGGGQNDRSSEKG